MSNSRSYNGKAENTGNLLNQNANALNTFGHFFYIFFTYDLITFPNVFHHVTIIPTGLTCKKIFL